MQNKLCKIPAVHPSVRSSISNFLLWESSSSARENSGWGTGPDRTKRTNTEPNRMPFRPPPCAGPLPETFPEVPRYEVGVSPCCPSLPLTLSRCASSPLLYGIMMHAHSMPGCPIPYVHGSLFPAARKYATPGYAKTICRLNKQVQDKTLDDASALSTHFHYAAAAVPFGWFTAAAAAAATTAARSLFFLLLSSSTNE